MKPEAYDPEGAKKLLAEAGYPSGFTITLAAPNNRYINDEQVAQAAAQMFSRIGVTTRVEAMPLSVYLGKARSQEFGVALLGWGSLASDLALRSLAATPSARTCPACMAAREEGSAVKAIGVWPPIVA